MSPREWRQVALPWLRTQKKISSGSCFARRAVRVFSQTVLFCWGELGGAVASRTNSDCFILTCCLNLSRIISNFHLRRRISPKFWPNSHSQMKVGNDPGQMSPREWKQVELPWLRTQKKFSSRGCFARRAVRVFSHIVLFCWGALRGGWHPELFSIVLY